MSALNSRPRGRVGEREHTEPPTGLYPPGVLGCHLGNVVQLGHWDDRPQADDGPLHEKARPCECALLGGHLIHRVPRASRATEVAKQDGVKCARIHLPNSRICNPFPSLRRWSGSAGRSRMGMTSHLPSGCTAGYPEQDCCDAPQAQGHSSPKPGGGRHYQGGGAGGAGDHLPVREGGGDLQGHHGHAGAEHGGPPGLHDEPGDRELRQRGCGAVGARAGDLPRGAVSWAAFAQGWFIRWEGLGLIVCN
mmetsp:Transcript_23182/g.72414  ORF Transcript_23182/g.72414 Transcript_23182/m.72414 type:complete len:249 (+) Transcript_23182:1021-1767(+)